MSLFGNVASMTKSLVVCLSLSLSRVVLCPDEILCEMWESSFAWGTYVSVLQASLSGRKGVHPPDASPVTSAQREHPNMGSMARKRKLENVIWVWPSIKMVRSLGMH